MMTRQLNFNHKSYFDASAYLVHNLSIDRCYYDCEIPFILTSTCAPASFLTARCRSSPVFGTAGARFADVPLDLCC